MDGVRKVKRKEGGGGGARERDRRRNGGVGRERRWIMKSLVKSLSVCVGGGGGSCRMGFESNSRKQEDEYRWKDREV